MSGSIHPPTRDPALRSWLDILPWLVDHRDGPPLLGEGELMSHAWMSADAGASVRPDRLGELSRRLGEVFVADHRDTPFGVAFPLAATDPGELDLSARARAALAGTVESLGEATVGGLLAVRGVGPSIVAEVVAASIRHSATVAAATPPAVAEFDRLVSGLDERDRYLLTARILTDDRATLSECSAVLGISRERVNQLDIRLRERVHTAFHASPPLRRVADGLVEAARPVAALDRLTAADPTLGAVLADGSHPLWFALARLDDRVDIVDGWVVAETMAAARQRTETVLGQYATAEGVVELAAVADAFAVSGDEARRWVAYCGYRVVGDHVLTRAHALPDRVAAVLALAGTPMTLDEIHAAIVPARSLSSVRNAVVSDERFVKADRTRWALARWGTARYIPIHRQIGEVLDECGGRIAVEELVRRLTTAFDVKEFSVRTYAASGAYATVDGIVSRREKAHRARKPPARTRHLYRQDSTWRWRTTLTAPHLKGSAFNLPSALAGLLGVGPDHPVELPSRLGPQSIIWVAVQARSGTIKRFVEDLGLRTGDEVFLEFATVDGTLGFDVVRADSSRHRDPLRAALAATGHDAVERVGEADLLATLAYALWLPRSADRATVVEALRTRREDTVADLVAG